jgi:DNA-binding response OmpR family regulator
VLRLLFENQGYSVIEVENGEQAVKKMHEMSDIDLCIMDMMMPLMTGIEATAEIRKFSNVPILFLTAKSLDSDKLSAYGVGGDDYIVKPFHATDLRLKIKAMLRRFEMYRYAGDVTPEETDGVIRFPGEVEWYPEEKAIYKQGERVELTEREYLLFARLASSRGENLTPATLYEDVWGETYLASSSNTVIVHIANLRRKLEKEPSSPALIRTVWGKGYRVD